jgi:hypothetical protein
MSKTLPIYDWFTFEERSWMHPLTSPHAADETGDLNLTDSSILAVDHYMKIPAGLRMLKGWWLDGWSEGI